MMMVSACATAPKPLAASAPQSAADAMVAYQFCLGAEAARREGRDPAVAARRALIRCQAQARAYVAAATAGMDANYRAGFAQQTMSPDVVASLFVRIRADRRS
jgi:hypothetical protein